VKVFDCGEPNSFSESGVAHLGLSLYVGDNGGQRAARMESAGRAIRSQCGGEALHETL